MTEQAQPIKPVKHRSPSYPSIDLKTAIGRLDQLRKVAGDHPAPLPAAVGAWGYTPKSSNGLLTVAALKKYGLTQDKGKGSSREVQITRLGQEILFFAETTGEWLERVQTAALKPVVHAELWKKYGPKLPEDPVMLHYLRFEREFSDAAGRDALRQFRATVSFARLADAAATVDPDGTDSASGELADGGPELTPPATITPPESPPTLLPADAKTETVRTTQTVQVTYSPHEWALLQGKFPMSEDDWDAMIDVLKAMRRGLVVPPETPKK
jgi:hypothetical protein